MHTLTLTADKLDQVRPGDRLVALDGQTLRRPLTVVSALAPLAGSTTQAIGMTGDGITTGVNLYPDTHVERTVTVERDDTARPQRTRTVAGLRLVSADGAWWTQDRRFEIRRGFGGMTHCEADHPARLTPGLVKAAQECPGVNWAQPILFAYSQGRRGFVCEAGTEHSYDCWQVWDHQTHDYAPGGSYADSLTDAAGSLSRYLARN